MSANRFRGAAATCHPMRIEEPSELARRRAGLLEPAMRPLAELAARIRAETGRPVPDADPYDGGTAARLRLLRARPAPAGRRGGFVSRDNATPTARNIRRFAEAAGLPRRSTLIWNAVPWMDDGPTARGALRREEIRAGLLWLPPLLALLAQLEVVVLAGRVARSAAGALRQGRLTVLEMPHPSPTIVCTAPQIGHGIAATLAAAAAARRRGGPIETDAD